jgi:hypothetical protein
MAPGLMVSRSFGDATAHSVGVSAFPSVTVRHIKKQDLVILVGSDGIWDMVPSGDAVRACIPLCATPEVGAKTIETMALNAWKEKLNADNIVIAMVTLLDSEGIPDQGARRPKLTGVPRSMIQEIKNSPEYSRFDVIVPPEAVESLTYIDEDNQQEAQGVKLMPGGGREASRTFRVKHSSESAKNVSLNASKVMEADDGDADEWKTNTYGSSNNVSIAHYSNTNDPPAISPQKTASGKKSIESFSKKASPGEDDGFSAAIIPDTMSQLTPPRQISIKKITRDGSFSSPEGKIARTGSRTGSRTNSGSGPRSPAVANESHPQRLNVEPSVDPEFRSKSRIAFPSLDGERASSPSPADRTISIGRKR